MTTYSRAQVTAGRGPDGSRFVPASEVLALVARLRLDARGLARGDDELGYNDLTEAETDGCGQGLADAADRLDGLLVRAPSRGRST